MTESTQLTIRDFDTKNRKSDKIILIILLALSDKVCLIINDKTYTRI